jgi:demethylmenaquinone methyltransferase / 2-methoxy-6-polyprenyl-1,4-benzoquinol methylase
VVAAHPIIGTEDSLITSTLDDATTAPTPGSPEKAAVRSMFDRIAPRYDLLNRLLSAGIDTRWRKRAVDALALGPTAHVLDLCTGTADLLIEALGRAPERRGTGIDLSAAMLMRGAGKLAHRGWARRAGLACGDGERLPVASGVFDGALVAFGIRNIGDPAAALRELVRVLRPGGRIVVLEFSMPPGLLGLFYRFYFAQVLPRIGGLLSGDPGAYAYLPASVARFPPPEAFGALLKTCGFERVAATALTGGIAYVYSGEKAA